MIKWIAIERYIESKRESQPAQAIHEWKDRAELRAIDALLVGLGKEAEHRYAIDAPFHYAVDLIAHVMVAGVFDETGLTEKELVERNAMMDTLLEHVGVLPDLTVPGIEPMPHLDAAIDEAKNRHPSNSPHAYGCIRPNEDHNVCVTSARGDTAVRPTKGVGPYG